MKTRHYVCFLLGQVGVISLTRFFFQWVVRFVDSRSGSEGAQALFSATLVGALFFAFRIFDGVVDPFMGAFGDRWVRKGRRREDLLPRALAWAPLGLVLVFSPSFSMAPLLRHLLLISGMILFFAGYSFYSVPLSSLVEDFSRGNVLVRSRLSGLLGLGLLVSTALGFVISPLLVNSLGFLPAAALIALVSGLLMYLPRWANADRQLSSPSGQGEALAPPDGLASSGALEILLGAWSSLAQVMRDRSFRSSVAMIAGSQMSFTIMTAAAPYLAEKLLGGTLSDVSRLLGPFLATSLLAVPFAPKLGRSFGTLRVLTVASFVLGFAYLGATWLGQDLIGSKMATAMLIFALAGPPAGLILGLQSDAVAEAASRAGGDKVGVYFGSLNLVVQSMNGLCVFLTGMFAEQSHGAPHLVRLMPMAAGGLAILGVGLSLLGRPGRAER